MPRKCAGTIEGELCQFSKVGGPTQPKPGQIRCVWCCPEAMQQACGTEGGLLRLAQLLRGMPEASRNLALRRLPADVHEEYFEAEFGEQFKSAYPMAAADSDFSMDCEEEGGTLAPDTELEADAGERIHADGFPLAAYCGGAGEENVVSKDAIGVGAAAGLCDELPNYEPEPFKAWWPGENEEEDEGVRTSLETVQGPKSKKRLVAKSKAKAAAIKKKPAARKAKPSELCPGRAGHPCVFSTTVPKSPALIHPGRNEKHCKFCSAVALEKALSSKRPKVLRDLKGLAEAERALALTAIAEWQGPEIAQGFTEKVNTVKKACERPDWKSLLEARQLLQAPLAEEEVEQYEKAVRQDRQRARRKVLCPEHKGKHGTRKQEEQELAEVRARCGDSADLASNDVGLPAPADATARMVEAWCKQGSWAMCERCHSLQPKNLEPMDLKRVAKATISAKACTACKHNEYVPALEDVPLALRSLPPRVVRALRPLDVDTGGRRKSKPRSFVCTRVWCQKKLLLRK